MCVVCVVCGVCGVCGVCLCVRCVCFVCLRECGLSAYNILSKFRNTHGIINSTHTDSDKMVMYIPV